MNPEDIQTKSAGAGLSLIMERFPAERQALRRLFRESLSCQSLCNDYECLAALQNRQQSTSEEAPAWRDEYAHLLLELGQEVRQYLENPAAFSTNR
jgi:hypothetical protein